LGSASFKQCLDLLPPETTKEEKEAHALDMLPPEDKKKK
jgi:hypothetical protein